jgi:ubiquinone/menaquinone biosynthesis C-methylase UbiE
MGTKDAQGKLWSVAPQYWAEYFEPWFLPMYKNVLAQLRLSDDDALLDVGCGSGLFSSLSIETGAHVTGIDAAPGLLEIARERNPFNEFLEEDIEALPFIDNTFNVVAGFNSFQYADSFENAIIEAKRVLAPQGRLVIGIWDKPECNDATQILMAINKLLPQPATHGPFALSEDEKIETYLSASGLRLTYKATVSCPFLFRTLNEAIKSFMGTGPAATALKYNDQKTVEAAIAKALNVFRVIDDIHFLQNQFLVFIAEK